MAVDVESSMVKPRPRSRRLEVALLAVLVVLPVVLVTTMMLQNGPLAQPLHSLVKLSKALEDLFPPELGHYPTDLTRDILTRHIHSHNDYWRTAPVYSALSVGAVSIESDIWLNHGELYVGHELSALTPARTLQSLYIEPLVQILELRNPATVLSRDTNLTINGIFDTASSQTLYLWIDIKTDGESTWPVVANALQPLRERGLLSYVHNSMFMQRPVTVIGTGNAPLLAYLDISDDRDFFFDVDIDNLQDAPFDKLTNLTTPIASGQYGRLFETNVRDRAGLKGEKLDLLRKQIETAHNMGIGVRYWDTPGWPIATRNSIWRQLWDEGVDLINVDALEDAASGIWR
jgi:hypothetical protein